MNNICVNNHKINPRNCSDTIPVLWHLGLGTDLPGEGSTREEVQAVRRTVIHIYCTALQYETYISRCSLNFHVQAAA